MVATSTFQKKTPTFHLGSTAFCFHHFVFVCLYSRTLVSVTPFSSCREFE